MALDLNELQQLVEQAKNSEAKTKDLKRGLVKVQQAADSLSEAVAALSSIIEESYTSAPRGRKSRAGADGEAESNDPDAPYGRKADGTPKKRPGRAKEAAE